MKVFVLLVAALCLFVGPVFAQEAGDNTTTGQGDVSLEGAPEANVSEEEVGALPGDFWYGFQRFFENVDKFLTWDKVDKAKKHASYGKLRAVEAHLMTKKAQELAAQGDLSGANETLQRVQELVEDQTEENEAAQEELEAAIDEGSATEEEIEEVEAELRNSIVVLQRVYEKVPEPAKDGVLRALNNSIANQERHEQKVQEKEMNQGDDEAEEAENESEEELED